MIEPWFSNRTTSLVKTPKLHLADGGLLCALLGVRTADELLASPLAGAIWETVVASELRRCLLNAGRPGELFFWRERQREVDLVIHRAGRFTLAEAKWTELPDGRDSDALRLVSGALSMNRLSRRAEFHEALIDDDDCLELGTRGARPSDKTPPTMVHGPHAH